MAVAFAVSAMADGSGQRARILRVDTVAAGEAAALAGLHLPKFHDALWEEPGEEFVVTWLPRAGGSPAGTVVRFHYRQQRLRRVQTLEVVYPFVVNRSRAATFFVTSRAFERGGSVTGWRVQLVEQGRVVAEKRSPGWS